MENNLHRHLILILQSYNYRNRPASSRQQVDRQRECLRDENSWGTAASARCGTHRAACPSIGSPTRTLASDAAYSAMHLIGHTLCSLSMRNWTKSWGTSPKKFIWLKDKRLNIERLTSLLRKNIRKRLIRSELLAVRMTLNNSNFISLDLANW